MKKLLTLFTILIVFGLAATPSYAQAPGTAAPDCIQTFNLTAAGRVTFGAGTNGNIALGCSGWILNYSSYGFSALSIELDRALNTTPGIPGSWTIWSAGSVVTGGPLPLTDTTRGNFSVIDFWPWVSVNVTSVTGSGVISGTLYGWKGQAPASALSLGTVTATQATGSNLHIVCDSGCSSSTAPADGTAFTAGVTSQSPAGGFYNSTRASLSSGTMGAIALNVNRALIVQLEDASKNAFVFPLALGAGGGLKIDGSGTALPVSGTVTATGTLASTIADGADVTLGAKADAKSTATDTTAITIMQVLKQISASVQAPPSQAVTNAGTFASQLTGGTSVTTTMQSAVTASGNGTVLATDGQGTARVTINCSVTCSGGTTVVFTSQHDGTNFQPIKGTKEGTDTIASTATPTGIETWVFDVSGTKQLRAAVATYSAGTLTVIGTTLPIANAPRTMNVNLITNSAGIATEASLGASTDAAASPGGTGSLSAKTRSISSQIDSINTAIATVNTNVTSLATAIGTNGIKIRDSNNGAILNTDILSVAGDVANDGVDSGNPVKVGGIARSSEPAAVSNADRAQFYTDLTGKQIILPYANPENFLQGTTAAITDTTSTSVIASAGGSLRNYVTDCTATNSHATVGTFIKILDGATIIYEAYAAPLGGGWAVTFPIPRKGTAATAINAQAVTTGANFIVSCGGYKGL